MSVVIPATTPAVRHDRDRTSANDHERNDILRVSTTTADDSGTEIEGEGSGDDD